MRVLEPSDLILEVLRLLRVREFTGTQLPTFLWPHVSQLADPHAVPHTSNDVGNHFGLRIVFSTSRVSQIS